MSSDVLMAAVKDNSTAEGTMLTAVAAAAHCRARRPRRV